MRDVLAIIGLGTVLAVALLLVLAACDWMEQRKWMTAAERQRMRRESREWGSR